jgi:transposase-like protein
MRVAVAFDEPLLATVAILHDVVEDSAYDLDYIHHMFGDEVSEAVEAISRVEGETYHDYIVRCSKNPLATKVKQQDLHDHLMRLHKIPDQETKESLEKRYKAARAYIEMVIHG